MTDPIAPLADGHEGYIFAVKDPPYTVGWFASCSCGFSGEPRPSPGAAAADLIGHRPQETTE